MPDEEKQPEVAQPEETKPAEKPAEEAQPKKSNKTLIIVLVIVGVIIVLSGIGYYAMSKFLGNKLAEGILETATGGQVDVNTKSGDVTIKSDDGTTQFGSTDKWPSDMPSVVPEFKYGTLKYASKVDSADSKGWNVIYESVKSTATASYKNDLTSKGWTNLQDMLTGEWDTFSAENGEWVITVMVDNTQNQATLTVAQKTQ
jgi:hypothetical protein